MTMMKTKSFIIAKYRRP